MPFIHVMTWPLKNESQVKKLQEDITYAVHKNTGAPLDKISVAISEILPSHWADAGVAGNSPEFQLKSRRVNYDDNMALEG